VVQGTDCNRGNMQHMVQQSVNHAIERISLCAVVMTMETLSCRKVCGVIVDIGRTFPPLKFKAS